MPRHKHRRSHNRRKAPRDVHNSRGDDSCEKVASDDGTQPSEEDLPDEADGGVSAESEISLHTDEELPTDSAPCDKEISSDRVIQENAGVTSAQGQTDQSRSDDKAPNYRVESPGFASPVIQNLQKSHSLGDDVSVQIQELSSEGSSLINSFDNPGNVSEPESSELEEDPLQDVTSPTDQDKEDKINDLIASFIESAPSREKSPPDPRKADKIRKRAAIESHFAPQFLNPRFLDSIREESSDTDAASDRLSVGNTQQNDEEDMFNEEDDDVFLDNTKITQKANAVFPKGVTLDLSTRRKHISALRKPLSGMIREEPACVLVDTKILEPEPIPGGSSRWETTKTDEVQGAEVVFLESGSSSASELDYSADGDAEDSDVRIETPVIEPMPVLSPPSPEPLPNPDECDIPEFNRQDSSGSVSSQTHSTSSHSQCTARYMASSMTDLEMDFEPSTLPGTDMPKTLRQQCLDRLSSMPYGEVVLRELADVSRQLTRDVSTPPPPVPALPAEELLIHVVDPQDDHYWSDPQVSHSPPPVPERPAPERPSSAHGALHGSRVATTKDDNRLLAIIRESEHEHQQSTVDPQSSETNPQARDIMYDPREFDNMFEAMSKRFSNFELGQRAPATKRYSNIETQSYESHKRTQDGQVVHEETKRHSERITDDNGNVSKSVESESVKPQVDKVGSVNEYREIDQNSRQARGDDFLREKVDDNFDFHTRRPNRITPEEFGRRAWESRSNLSVVDECPENVTRPLAREDNLCRGQRSGTEIKAPRITLDTNITEHLDALQNKVTQRRSMIDTTPITRHVAQNGTQRRLSLPKDFHEKQLQYIRQKEAKLQDEFEKLELDRKRLEEEITSMRMSTVRSDGQCKRSSLLSDEEVFRQQMHSEWLDKVAEREERRLHKIIKITKPEEPAPPPKSHPVDIENEFLRKVKERRTKLSMPADSDWESGAESQPHPQEAREPKVHNIQVKVVDGERQSNVKVLPKHLQEFAESFTSHGEQSDPRSPSSSSPGTRFYAICAVVVILGWTLCRPLITNRK